MIQNRTDSDFETLKRAYPDAKLTRDRKFVLVPEVLLPSKFNSRSTPVLISLTDQYTAFGLPAVYVLRRLRIRKRLGSGFQKSSHLAEILTEEEMLRKGKGWVKLCWENPPRVNNLAQLMVHVILYLERLKE
jgi:hypothetical protein